MHGLYRFCVLRTGDNEICKIIRFFPYYFIYYITYHKHFRLTVYNLNI